MLQQKLQETVGSDSQMGSSTSSIAHAEKNTVETDEKVLSQEDALQTQRSIQQYFELDWFILIVSVCTIQKNCLLKRMSASTGVEGVKSGYQTSVLDTTADKLLVLEKQRHTVYR